MKPRIARRKVAIIFCCLGSAVVAVTLIVNFNAGLEAKELVFLLLNGAVALTVGLIGIARSRKQDLFDQILQERPRH